MNSKKLVYIFIHSPPKKKVQVLWVATFFEVPSPPTPSIVSPHHPIIGTSARTAVFPRDRRAMATATVAKPTVARPPTWLPGVVEVVDAVEAPRSNGAEGAEGVEGARKASKMIFEGMESLFLVLRLVQLEKKWKTKSSLGGN